MVFNFLWIIHSDHWKGERFEKSEEITDDIIEYVIMNSKIFPDRIWENVLNALYRVPSSGRLLKVVYKRLSKDKIVIITAMWMD